MGIHTVLFLMMQPSDANYLVNGNVAPHDTATLNPKVNSTIDVSDALLISNFQ